MKKIAKPHYTEHAVYYEQYINKIPDDTNVLQLLKTNAKKIEIALLELSEEKLLYAYAEGKWSIKDILQHLIDCERIFVYRAMRFARNDKAPLLFFEEDEYAKQAQANKVPIKKLLKEYKTNRQATLAFFQNQTANTLKRTGIASNATMSVCACAWIICSHEIHHWNVILEKYLK